MLQSEIKEVSAVAVRLLVLSHLSLHESIAEEDRVSYINFFKSQIFDYLQPDKKPSAKVVMKLNTVIKSLIF